MELIDEIKLSGSKAVATYWNLNIKVTAVEHDYISGTYENKELEEKTCNQNL